MGGVGEGTGVVGGDAVVVSGGNQSGGGKGSNGGGSAGRKARGRRVMEGT